MTDITPEHYLLLEFVEMYKKGLDFEGFGSSKFDRLVKSMENEIPKESQAGLAVKIARLTAQYAKESLDKNDLFASRTRMTDLGVLYDRFGNSEEIALKFLDVIKGLLGLKYEKGEHDNLEDFYKDIVSITNKFPANEQIAIQGCMCYSNLLFNRMNDPWGERDLWYQVVDRVEEISNKFPANEDINIVYSRILASCISALSHRPDVDLFKRCVSSLRKLVKNHTFTVDSEIRNLLQLLDKDNI